MSSAVWSLVGSCVSPSVGPYALANSDIRDYSQPHHTRYHKETTNTHSIGGTNPLRNELNCGPNPSWGAT